MSRFSLLLISVYRLGGFEQKVDKCQESRENQPRHLDFSKRPVLTN